MGWSTSVAGVAHASSVPGQGKPTRMATAPRRPSITLAGRAGVKRGIPGCRAGSREEPAWPGPWTASMSRECSPSQDREGSEPVGGESLRRRPCSLGGLKDMSSEFAASRDAPCAGGAGGARRGRLLGLLGALRPGAPGWRPPSARLDGPAFTPQPLQRGSNTTDQRAPSATSWTAVLSDPARQVRLRRGLRRSPAGGCRCLSLLRGDAENRVEEFKQWSLSRSLMTLGPSHPGRAESSRARHPVDRGNACQDLVTQAHAT